MFVNTTEFVIQYLIPRHAGADIRPEKPNSATGSIPDQFILVTTITPYDDKVTEHAMVEIECFDADFTAAQSLARLVHQDMLTLSNKVILNLPSGPTQIDRCHTINGPAYANYRDEGLTRFVARYEIESRINSQPLF